MQEVILCLALAFLVGAGVPVGARALAGAGGPASEEAVWTF